MPKDEYEPQTTMTVGAYNYDPARELSGGPVPQMELDAWMDCQTLNLEVQRCRMELQSAVFSRDAALEDWRAMYGVPVMPFTGTRSELLDQADQWDILAKGHTRDTNIRAYMWRVARTIRSAVVSSLFRDC